MTMLEILVGYCNRGWKIFPLRERDKIPATDNGFKDATNDFTKIFEWYSENENYNWGLATGELVVIDIDPKNGGSLESIDLPKTLTVRTGSGGYHLYYKHPGRDIRNSASKLAQGIDVRGYGGYVVLPPSIHPNGNSYEWENDLPIAELPVEILDRLTSEREYIPFVQPTTIEEGKRNDTLFRLASSLWARGLSENEIQVTLEEVNRNRCTPPLEEEEVFSIVKSASRYEQGEIFVPDKSTSLEYSLTDLGNAERLVNQHGKIIRTYLKNGRLRSNLSLGADRWISKTNNGQLWNRYFRKWNAERMAKDAREWTIARS